MSELRQDLISGDWIVLAPSRAGRPNFLDKKRPARTPALKSDCPFEESFLRAHGDWPPLAAFPNEKQWKVVVIPNKYPALASVSVCSVPLREGIYAARTGVGEHDLILTRDHRKNFPALSPSDAAEVLTIFQDLCARSAKDPCAIYAVPFWNWGPLAGASVWHPHYQFLSLPVVPPHSARSLAGAAAYFKKNHRCAQCDIIRFERAEKRVGKTRIIAENADAIAVAPYASKLPFEVRIMPKRHEVYFYKSRVQTIRGIAGLTQNILHMMKKKLNDPDVNVFIHESPLDGKTHDYHHWHIEILPRLTTPAGFELSTGVYINITPPETVPAILHV